MQPIIQVRHLTKTYGSRFNQTKVLNNLSFSINAGEFVAIMGPSGAGKTTLIQLLASINTPTVGTIEMKGNDLLRMNEQQLSEFRQKEVGFIFQDFNLLSSLTIKDNILLPLAIQKLPIKIIDERLKLIAVRLGIDQLLNYYPNELSVGQKQRVAAARAMITEPAIIFADEPTGALDSKSAADLLTYLSLLNKEDKTTIVMVTHDPFSASYCNRILFIKDGTFFAELIKQGRRNEFFEQIIDMQAAIGGGGRRHV